MGNPIRNRFIATPFKAWFQSDPYEWALAQNHRPKRARKIYPENRHTNNRLAADSPFTFKLSFIS
jgi:hypothetical protein